MGEFYQIMNAVNGCEPSDASNATVQRFANCLGISREFKQHFIHVLIFVVSEIAISDSAPMTAAEIAEQESNEMETIYCDLIHEGNCEEGSKYYLNSMYSRDSNPCAFRLRR